jgi:branched-chain amino acid transport system substrate-binding protein
VYRDAFVAAGGQVVAYEAYDPRATDFTGVLLRMRASNPDVIWLQGDVPEIPTLVSQIRRLGLNQAVATTSIGQNNRVLEQLGPAAEGLFVTSLAPGAEDRPAVGEYQQEWRRRENREPNGLPFTQYFYDAGFLSAALFGWALERNLPPTGENLRRALLEHGPFDLPLTGELRIETTGGRHTVRKPVYMLQVRGGAFRPHAKIDI